MRPRRKQARSGLTLLEIVLAIGLAAIAIALLTQLMAVGNRAASAARDSAKAQMVAQSVISEVLAGIIPAQSANGDYEADPMWTYQISVGTGASQTINIISVTVTHKTESPNPATFSLTQWQAIPPEEEEATDDTDDSSGGSI